MPLTISADKLDDLPEGLRDIAKEVNGKFVVGAMKEGWGIEDLVGLKRALSDERSARKDNEVKLRNYAGIDDPAAALDALERLRGGGLKSSKEIDEFKKTLEAKMANDLRSAHTERDTFRGQAEQLLVDGQLREALAKAGANQLGMEYLPDRIKARHVKVDRTNSGTLAVAIHDANGKPMITGKSGSGESMTFAEFANVLRADASNAAFFNGSGAAGGRTSSQHAGSAPTASMKDNANLSSRELFGLANKSTA